MTEARDFGPIADSLRRSVTEFYEHRGEALDDPAGLNTLETNSGYVERRARPLLEMLTRHSPLESIEGLRLLDLGCGFGALAAYFAAQGAHVIGIDPNEERLSVGNAVAAEHGLSLELRRGRMQKLDFPDRSFDLAVLNNSLCYIVPREERAAALSETLRVLRPGGLLISRNPNQWNPLDQFTGLPLIQLLPPRRATQLAETLGRKRSMVRLTSPREAAGEMREAGFGTVKHVGSPASSWHSALKVVARYHHLIGERPKSHPVASAGRGMKYQHLIVTRFTIKGWAYDEFTPEWLDERFRLFRTYCVPSMAAQTLEDFTWAVLCDETTDRDFLERVKECAELVPQLRIAYTSRDRDVHIPEAIDPLIDEDSDVLVRTRLDSDDALNAETVATLQTYVEPFFKSEKRNRLVNFPRGYRYEEATRRVYATYWPHGPFATLFERKMPASKRYNLYRNHHRLYLHVPVHFDESLAGWLQLIHGLADSTEIRAGVPIKGGNLQSSIRQREDIAVDPGEIDGSFGVDLRELSAPAPGKQPQADG
jgi:ubiquinone/menaquinone biosynthesis C-methylase UbiE